MRLRLAVLLTILIGPGSLGPTAAQQAFPYKAHIAADDTYVRSGPGESFYPTGKLKAGAQVEVYRHGPGGWYAIRPPDSSFSWIGGRHLRPAQDGLAEITGDRVAVRVGSQLSDRRDVVQVRVKRGEVVEVLGTEQAGSGRSGAIWYRIAPPSGEFRWVRGSDVDSSPSRGGADKTGQPAAPPPKTVEAAAPTASAKPSVSQTLTRGDASPSAAKWTPAPASAIGPRTSEEFQKELDDVNTELSIMLAEEPAAWDCGELGRRAQTLLDNARTAVERGHARMLVNRISQSEDIRRRSLALNSPAADVARRGRPPADRTSGAGATTSARGSEARFDGVGRLARVQQPKAGAPRYALMDEQGNVKAYVSPAPGLSMQPYVGHQVGISGIRGFLGEQNVEHLTAKQITALDTRLR